MAKTDENIALRGEPAEQPVPGRGQRIQRSALHQQVVEQLREMIFEGDLVPGARIPERMLCENFGISRTPLREALRVLASEGLVEHSPHRGASVSKLRPEDLDHMFQVMETLEALAGALACEHVNDAELATIRAMHKTMLEHYTRGERRAYFQINQAIHKKIVELARNPVLQDIYGSLSGRIRRARYLANMDSDRWRQAIDEHEQILDALEHRDGARLSQLLKDHLQHKYDVLKSVLTKEHSQA